MASLRAEARSQRLLPHPGFGHALPPGIGFFTRARARWRGQLARSEAEHAGGASPAQDERWRATALHSFAPAGGVSWNREGSSQDARQMVKLEGSTVEGGSLLPLS